VNVAARKLEPAAPFFVTGGTLRLDAASYVPRRADEELYRALMRGEFCYLLTSRQMGKSSLLARTAERLRREGGKVAALDVTALGQNLTIEQWYGGLAERLGRQFDLEDEMEDFWDDHAKLPPLQRWMEALVRLVLARLPGRVFVFIDEIDYLRSLAFSPDEFLAGIRELYNRRVTDPDLDRLSFCLAGVATPADLIRDVRTTPFNIGRRIDLTDFTVEEAAPLAEGIGRSPEAARRLVERAIHWTGGHPFLTQKLCAAVAQDDAAAQPRDVDRLCDELYLSERAQERDDNLVFARNRMLRGSPDLASLLTLYKRVRRGRPVSDNEADPLVATLKLSGVTAAEAGFLRVRNRIYRAVFDDGWIRRSMPDAERRRQRAAFLRGALLAGGVGAALVAAMAGLAFWAHAERAAAVQAEADARLSRDLAVAAEAKAKRALGETALLLDGWVDTIDWLRREAVVETRVLEQMVKRSQPTIDKVLASLDAGDDDLLRVRGEAAASYASLFQRVGELAKAVALTRQSLSDFERIRQKSDEDRARIATQHYRLGRQEDRRGQIESAFQSIGVSLVMRSELAERGVGDRPYRELASSHMALAELYADTGRFEDAVAEYEEASDSMRRQLEADPENADWRSYLATIADNWGEVMSRMGDHRGAEARHRAALADFRALEAKHSGATRFRRSALRAETRLAVALAELGEAEEALAILERQADNLHLMLGDDAGNTFRQSALSAMHHARARVLQLRGPASYDDAIVAVGLSLEIRNALAQRDRQNEEWQRQALESDLLAGQLQRLLGRNDAAFDIFSAALQRVSSLIAENGQDVALLREQAKILRELAGAEVALGRIGEGWSHYERAIAGWRALLDKSNVNAAWRKEVADTHAQYADALRQRGALADAINHQNAALRLREELYDEDGESGPRLTALSAGCVEMRELLKLAGRIDEARALEVRVRDKIANMQTRFASVAPARVGVCGEPTPER